MKIVYHGSPNSNIKKLIARKSTHQKECIYASEDKVVAMLHTGKGNGDLDTKVSSIDGKIELIERREGILKTLYDKEGYIYELEGTTFNHYDYLWSKEMISFEKSIKPLKKIYYLNILDELYKEEKKGNIIIYKYPNRPKSVPLDNSDLIDKFINFEKSGLTGALNHMLKIYPEFEKEVKEKLTGGEK